MSVASSLRTGGEFLALVAVAALVLGAAIGQPVLLGFVETGSMEPTLRPGDGFVAVPSAVAGDVQQGDVIVFQAKRLHGGGLTTHRVVGEVDEGYITQGDANPSTDQAGDEPPVKDAQIVAEVLQINGVVLVVPYLGVVVTGTQNVFASIQTGLTGAIGLQEQSGTMGFSVLVLGISVVGYLISWWRERRDGSAQRHRSRSRDSGVDGRLILVALALVVVLTATASMVVPAGSQEYGFVSSSHDTPGASVIGVGETETTTHVVVNGGFLPVVTFLEADGDRISASPTRLRVGSRASANATVTLSAPPETGYYRQFLVEHRYLAVLPRPAIASLYAIHPWLPIVVIDALLGVSFYLLGVALVGTGRVRSRSRETSTASRRLLNRYL
jgi:signal peptidase